MHHFFAEASDITDRDICLRGDNYNHIKNVLRMKPGEVISVSDGVSDKEYRCHIVDYSKDAVLCRLDFIKDRNMELPVKVWLFQSLPKADKMEFVIQKAVELGVAEIFPVASKRCVVKLDGKRAAGKTARWNMIAEAAAKQCGGNYIPRVHDISGFTEALACAANCNTRIIPYELAEDFSKTRQIIDSLEPGGVMAVFIGPEGGFEEEEIEEARAAGVIPVTLGRRILRTETAAMVVLSWLLYRLES